MILELTQKFKAVNLPDFGIIVMAPVGWGPEEKTFILLDSHNPDRWMDQLHMKILLMWPREEKELIEDLKSKCPLSECPNYHTFISGRTQYSIIPTMKSENEIIIFDLRRHVWLIFDFMKQYDNLERYGFACKARTIARQAERAFGMQFEY
jgi:hypothetical protein